MKRKSSRTKSKRSRFDLYRLPDTVLLSVVRLISLRDQFRFGLVCRRFRSIQQSISAELRSRVTSLRVDLIDWQNDEPKWESYSTTYIDFFNINTQHDVCVQWCGSTSSQSNNDLMYLIPGRDQSDSQDQNCSDHFQQYDILVNRHKWHRLRDSFPAIQHLSVIGLDPNQCDDRVPIEMILSTWPALTSLQIFGLYHPEAVQTQLRRLKHLKRLSIEATLTDIREAAIELPQLTEINFKFDYLENDNYNLPDSFVRWSSGFDRIANRNDPSHDTIDSLGLFFEQLPSKIYRDDTNFSCATIRRLRRVTIDSIISISDLRVICRKWKYLTFLDFMPKPNVLVNLRALSKLLDALIPLTELRHLCIRFRTDFCECERYEGQRDEPLPVLASVRCVKIFVCADCFTKMYNLGYLRRAFPNVERFSVNCFNLFSGTFVRSWSEIEDDESCDDCNRVNI